MKRISRPRWRMALLFVAFVLSAGVLGTLILRKYELSRIKTSPPPQVQQSGTILATVFFVSPDGTGLVREAREIEACLEPAECAEEVLGELINGPVGDMIPSLPATATIHSVRVDGETALVDFGKEFIEGLQAGSHAEMMAVYSVVDSLAFNFPRIKKVKFLLEGKDMESLGHLDLREPLEADFTLEKKN